MRGEGLGLGQADVGDLRFGEDGAGRLVVVQAQLELRDQHLLLDREVD